MMRSVGRGEFCEPCLAVGTDTIMVTNRTVFYHGYFAGFERATSLP